MQRWENKQSGFSLFIVIIAMLVIAFLVISTLQSTNMESRSSANDADRKVALAQAQSALNASETKIAELVNESGTITFTDSCTSGFCAAKDTPATVVSNGPYPISSSAKLAINCGSEPCADLGDAWRRNNVLTVNSDSQSVDPSIPVKSGGTYQNARYVIEFIGTQTNNSTLYYLFRVTAKGWGQNANTQVVLQSYEKAVFSN